ncbi:MAG: DUF378 domain-containing protein [Candidatus Pacebacteria bacterium]|nr:DUF378 domain-containing protein [Candidatus Paceibacterota bacterium]
MSKKSGGLNKVAWILVIIGALNWGLVGIGSLASANWNIVYLLIGTWAGMTVLNIVYILVGLSALVLLFGKGKKGSSCGPCESGTCTAHGDGM